MTKNLLVMTVSDMEAFQQRYRDLLNVNQVYRSTFVSVPSALHQLRAAMTEVDLYDAADEFVRTVPATVSTLRHIYINDFVVWLLAHMEGK